MQVVAVILHRDDGVLEEGGNLVGLDILPLLVEPEPRAVVGVVEHGVANSAIQLVNGPGVADRPEP